MPIAAYTSATGLEASQRFLDVTGNNLANANTTAFKTATPNFQDQFYELLQGTGPVSRQDPDLFSPVGVQAGLGVALGSVTTVFTQGAVQPVGGELNVAISGDGFFQVLQPDGTTAYTRDGTFALDATGRLITQQGFPVVGPIVVPPDTQSISIGTDGTVSVTTAAAPGQSIVVGQITLARFANPAGLLRLGTNLFAQTVASGPPQLGAGGAAGFGVLQQGALENSNVDVTTELITLILAQRSFSFNAQAFSVASDILRATADLIS